MNIFQIALELLVLQICNNWHSEYIYRTVQFSFPFLPLFCQVFLVHTCSREFFSLLFSLLLQHANSIRSLRHRGSQRAPLKKRLTGTTERDCAVWSTWNKATHSLLTWQKCQNSNAVSVLVPMTNTGHVYVDTYVPGVIISSCTHTCMHKQGKHRLRRVGLW